ncbi:MAG: hypothetical protein LQ351_003356 [Letrouitia transgressa]|nr:MAG: hypothetical protein LQ351_003356 [Letrouitia transgressa]
MLDVSTSHLPTLSTTCPINNNPITEEQLPSPPSRSPLKSHKGIPADGSTRQRRVAAAQAAKREIRANVREDWVWPCPLHNPTTTFPRRRKSTQWREREIDLSAPPSRSPSPSQPDPYKFDSPESVGSTVEARGWKRVRLVQEEMLWNEGLKHFVERRDAWTGAEARPEDQDQDRVSNVQTHNDITHQGGPSPVLESKYVIVHRERNHTSPDSGSTPALEIPDPSTSSKAQSPSLTNSGADSLPAQHPSSEPSFTTSANSSLLIPLAPPLLSPSDHPDLSKITPDVYPTIYSKVVIQGVSPTFPINLGHMVKALVKGWKEDGEWPSATRDDGRRGIKERIVEEGEGMQRVARKSVGKMKKVLGLRETPEVEQDER